MRYTRIPSDTFKKLQLNAGIIVLNFDTSTGEVNDEDIAFGTSGGVSFEATPSFTDFGEDIDNCPKNTMELKQLDSWEVKLSGSAVSADTTVAQMLIGVADVSGTKVTPRSSVNLSDFRTVWWVGDYSDENGENGGYIAIEVLNALSTGGFKLQSTDKSKGLFDFELTGHSSLENPDVVPFNLYIKEGVSAAG